MKKFPFIKPVLFSFAILLTIVALYQKGVVGQHLYLFCKGYRIADLKKCAEGYTNSHQYFLAVKHDTGKPPAYIPVERLGDD